MSDSTQVSEVAQETSNQFLTVIDGITERVAPLIDTIAEQLGVASEFVFETLIRQAYVIGITYVIIYIIGAVIIYNAITLWTKAPKTIGEEADVLCSKALVATFLGIVSTVFFMSTIEMTMTCLINPEFWALNYILDKL